MNDMLMADVYAGDKHFDLKGLAAQGQPWIGAMGKATQGTYYYDAAWFNWFWSTVADTERYGEDWFALAYHYFDCSFDPLSQADYFLRAVEKAGGWRKGDLMPCVDIERASQKQNVTAAMVIDKMTKWAEKVSDATGSPIVMYGGSYIRDLGIRDRMGCDYVWVADYEAKLNSKHYTDMGYDLSSLFAWQGIGKNGDGTVDGSWFLPKTTPVGTVDLSAITIAGGGQDAIDFCKAHVVGK